MLNKTQFAWSFATLALLTAAGLGGALYRTHKTTEKRQEIITYLRNEQSKISTLSKKDTQQYAAKVAQLEAALHAAHTAQRELTSELKQNEDDVLFLLDDIARLEATSVAANTTNTVSALPQFIALRQQIVSGREYGNEWEALLRVAPMAETLHDIFEMERHGIMTRKALQKQLRELYAQISSPEEDDVFPWLTQWSHLITIRKPTHSKLDRYVERGEIEKAAAYLRKTYTDAQTDSSEWIHAYDAHIRVMNALEKLEILLAQTHG